MGYDSLRIELRYRHIWQTKWAAAANSDEVTETTVPTSTARGGRRGGSMGRNVHYETEPDPGVDSPIGNAPGGPMGPNNAQPANKGRGPKSFRNFRQVYALLKNTTIFYMTSIKLGRHLGIISPLS